MIAAVEDEIIERQTPPHAHVFYSVYLSYVFFGVPGEKI
jgi:hypothetical protein